MLAILQCRTLSATRRTAGSTGSTRGRLARETWGQRRQGDRLRSSAESPLLRAKAVSALTPPNVSMASGAGSDRREAPISEGSEEVR